MYHKSSVFKLKKELVLHLNISETDIPFVESENYVKKNEQNRYTSGVVHVYLLGK